MIRFLLASLLVSRTALAGPISLTASDGVTLAADEFGSGANGVVLVHGKGRSAEDWTLFAERLAGRGFHVVALDLRGHGDSTIAAELTAADYPKMTADVASAVGWLRQHGAASVHLVGAELGANLAVQVAAADPQVADLALLSPGMNLDGVASPSALEAYGDRPALLVVSREDAYAMRSAGVLEGKAQGRFYIETLDNAGSGIRMLNSDPGLEGKLVAWLNGTYDLNATRAARTVTTEQTDTVETTGVRFGDD
jgi:pimeloyl-ACP methyl ester carboxylesterase